MHSIRVNERQIWLWHNRLRHPSFQYLSYLFLELFTKVNESDFKYEACFQVKSHRVPYLISLNKCDIPFSIIHSDVWGYALINIPYCVQWFITFIDDYT